MGEGADPRCWLTLAVVLARFMILLNVTVVIVASPEKGEGAVNDPEPLLPCGVDGE